MKNYKEWLSEAAKIDPAKFLNEEQIDWCNKYIAIDWWVNSDGEVEVKHDLWFKLEQKEEYEFPVQFADVKGSFRVTSGTLKSYKGSPRKVAFDVHCNSECTSLEGCPQEVGGDFRCTGNKNLKDLKGGPVYVNHSYDLRDCENLESLEGIADYIGLELTLNGCEKLKSFKGVNHVKGRILARGSFSEIESLEHMSNAIGSYEFTNFTKVKTLKGVAEKMTGNFITVGFSGIASLEGSPREVGGEFSCRNSENLVTLKGGPVKVEGHFDCSNCPKLTTLRYSPEAEFIELKNFPKDALNIDPKELKLLDDLGIEKFHKWATSDVSVEDFEHKYRGHIVGKKFGL